MRGWLVRTISALALLALAPAALYGCPGCAGVAPPPVPPEDPDGRVELIIEEPVVDNGDTTYTFISRILGINQGNQDLDSCQIIYDLEIPFGARTFVIDSVWTASQLVLNGGYDGKADSSLLAGDDTIRMGRTETFFVESTVELETPWIAPFEMWAYGYIRLDGWVFGDSAKDSLFIPPPGPPPANPDFEVTKQVEGGVVDNGDTTYTATMLVTLHNSGDVVMDSVQVIDNLSNTFNPYSFTVDSVWTATALTKRGTYDGGAADDSVLVGTDSLDADEAAEVRIITTVDTKPNVNQGPFENWAKGWGRYDGVVYPDSSADSVFIPPVAPPPNDPDIALEARLSGGINDNGDSTYSFCIYMEATNVGNVVLDSIRITNSLENTFNPHSYAIDSLVFSNLTENSGYDGNTDSLLTQGDDQLAVADTGTVRLYVTLDTGDPAAGPFTNHVVAKAFFSGAWYADSMDVGVTLPPVGSGVPIYIDDTGVVVTAIPFHRGKYFWSEKAVTNWGVRTAEGTYVRSDAWPINSWGDGSVRWLRVTFVADTLCPHEFVVETTKSFDDTVDTSADPKFKVVVNGQTYDFQRSDFTMEPDIGRGNVYRQGFATKNDGTTYGGYDGGIEVGIWHRWHYDGSTRSYVYIRNRNMSPRYSTAYQMHTNAAYLITPPIGDWGPDGDGREAADITINADGGESFDLRWSEDMSYGSGADTTTLHYWYDGILPNDAEGQIYGGGVLRPGEDLAPEITVDCDADPPKAWLGADYYDEHDMAFGWTIPKWEQATVAGADSLVSIFNSQCHMTCDSLYKFQREGGHTWAGTHWDGNWDNARDFGAIFRDHACYNGGVSHRCVTNDQYDVWRGIMTQWLRTSGVYADSLPSDVNEKWWQIWTRGVTQLCQGKLHVDYGNHHWMWYNNWPHTPYEHAANRARSCIPRSGTMPDSEWWYVKCLPNAFILTSDPYYKHCFLKWSETLAWYPSFQYYYDLFDCCAGRSWVNAIGWCAAMAHFSADPTWFDMAQLVIDNTFMSEAWFPWEPGYFPNSPGGMIAKPPFVALGMFEVRSLMKAATEYGYNDLASDCSLILSEMAELIEDSNYTGDQGWETIYFCFNYVSRYPPDGFAYDISQWEVVCADALVHYNSNLAKTIFRTGVRCPAGPDRAYPEEWVSWLAQCVTSAYGFEYLKYR